ncbi:MAG: SCPU domain-containing protein [Comamonadaceae bacterium]|nr:MAG: SCPU domain-containing protein [Comamonadaceae bacterium]
MNKLSLIAASLLAAAFAGNAAAATATANFQVLIKVQKACSVTAGASSNIDFGTVDSSATGLTGGSSISVTCSRKTPYSVGLLPSNNNTSGAGSMAALNVAPVTGNTDAVPYQLRSASTAGNVWGSTVANGAVAGIGNGVAQLIPVFATAPGANVTPDSYADTVTVQVTY